MCACEWLSVEWIVGCGEEVADYVLPVADLPAARQDHRILHDLAHDRVLREREKMYRIFFK